MKVPAFMDGQGSIGVPAPSFGATTEPYASLLENAVKTFRQKGCQVQLYPNCKKDDGKGISSTPESCGRELTEAYLSKDNEFLISCGGGELMCQTLDYVDFDAIREAPPKWFMGYSDNTNFTFLLNTIADVASIYGPCFPTFGMRNWHEALEQTWEVITRRREPRVRSFPFYEKESLRTEEDPLAPWEAKERSLKQFYLHGRPEPTYDHMQGRLLGGCLDCLQVLCGTRFDKVAAFNDKYGEDGILWFFEACDLPPVGVRRALWQLREAGWFDAASGFIIGRPLRHDEEAFGMDQREAAVGFLSDLDKPILWDADVGHLPPTVPLLSGCKARVSFEGGQFELQMLPEES